MKSFVFLLLLTSLLFTITVSADSDGSLILNTDILTKNQVQTSGVGEFPIRGELFSSQLTTLTEKNEIKQKEVIKNAKSIDFSNKNVDVSGGNQVKRLLFENYQPQVITKKNQEETEHVNLLLVIAVPSLFLLLGIGMFAGRWRAKSKRKKLKVRKYNND
ncbi:hypothetical protein [Listeria innocua]|uniref:hypothetical protein n=1 Tax=Listeria innocua TaxID=1642 RepID=UPI00162579B3|nr:hypothetical protein [Listeria innocua]MBC1925545.1 hypothetical protein [Listeria innocua]